MCMCGEHWPPGFGSAESAIGLHYHFRPIAASLSHRLRSGPTGWPDLNGLAIYIHTQVFRSDNSYSRFKDGSVYLWEITTSIRSYIRRLVGWTSSSRTTADERVATEQIILACCLLHQWIMNEYLRDNGPMHEQLHGRKVHEDVPPVSCPGCNPVCPASLQPRASQVHEDLLCAALGVASSSEIIDGQDTPTPYLGLTAIILGATKRLPSLTDQERVGLEDELGDVASNLGQCERLLRQPIPLGYERSTIRFLWYGYRYRSYESKDKPCRDDLYTRLPVEQIHTQSTMPF